MSDPTSRSYAAVSDWPATLGDWLAMHSYAVTWRASLEGEPAWPWDELGSSVDPEVLAAAEAFQCEHTAMGGV